MGFNIVADRLHRLPEQKKLIKMGRRFGAFGATGFLAFSLILSGCSGDAAQSREPDRIGEERTGEDIAEEATAPVIGLILTSQDDKENESVTADFQEAARAAGARLLVRAPDVSYEEAQEAFVLEGSFVLCDVNPIEYQMLLVNEMVAEDVDVIAIHANHRTALEPVLSAARAVGIRVCAFGCEVGENSCDVYAATEDAPQKAVELLSGS